MFRGLGPAWVQRDPPQSFSRPPGSKNSKPHIKNWEDRVTSPYNREVPFKFWCQSDVWLQSYGCLRVKHKINSFIACRRTGTQWMVKISIRICSSIKAPPHCWKSLTYYWFQCHNCTQKDAPRTIIMYYLKLSNKPQIQEKLAHMNINFPRRKWLFHCTNKISLKLTWYLMLQSCKYVWTLSW